ncbi:hypothetical protein DEO72_LG9g1249 [Vigna unguiculata]|uniref:Uncharacterized protein n=1 Tax=Vigna unguiculata TaxID=3917 RepID=A0A4D6MYY1_VIGUN|nr:hypothetical protein DEO72_LG9g1249 [Vigna unguiculata]
MPETSGNAAKMVRVGPRRGKIKAKIMSNLFRIVEEAGRGICSKVQVAEESPHHPSQPHHSGHYDYAA